MNFIYNKFTAIILLLILFLQFSTTFSQNEYIKFDRISIEDGLSQSSIFAILQDEQGFLWFGTQNGLNKYDGNSFKVYKYTPFDSTSLSDNWVQKIVESKDGNLWLGTYSGGLFRFLRDEDRFINYRTVYHNYNSLSNNRIWTLHEDREGFLWIGTAGGLDKFDIKTGRFSHYKKINGTSIDFSSFAVNSIWEDDEGFLWFGTWGGGLIKYDKKNNKFSHISFAEDSKNEVRIKSFAGDKNYLWITTVGNGVIRYNRLTGDYKFITKEDGLSDNSVLAIIIDKKENIWLGTHSGGLNMINHETGEITVFKYSAQNEFSVSDNWIQSLFEDASGIIWIGTGNGISKYVPERQGFTHIQNDPNDPNSLIANDVRAIREDDDGNLWIGTWNYGLSIYERSKNNFTNFKYSSDNINGIPSNIVTSIIKDENNIIWIGTANGLVKYEKSGNKFIVFSYSENDSSSLSHNNVSCLFEDSFGNIWVGTWGGGINKFDKKNKFIRYGYNPDDDKSISDDIITCIYEDDQQRLYIGTNAGGVNLYDRQKNKFVRYQYDKNNRNSLSNNNINTICQTKDGTLWIGTLGGGLNYLDKDRKVFKQISESDGLISNAVFGLLEDNNNHLWISTSRGLSNLDLSNIRITNYDIKDGLVDLEFTPGYYKSKDGTLFFGGRKGITVINPAKVALNKFKAPVIISSFKVFDKELKFDKEISRVKEIELGFSENVFSIDYAALNYARSDRLEYLYILEGFDKDWIFAGSRKTAYYTNLSPGKYIFKVKANNGNDIWSESKIPLNITIIPPIWMRWWFILLVLGTVVLIGTSLYRYRVNRLLEIERLRTRIASDLHDELASNLSSIAMFSRIILNEGKSYFSQQSSAGQLLERITSLSQESVISIREIIWALDPKPESVHDLLVRTRDMIISSCRANNITLNCDFPQKDLLPSKNLSPEVRKNLRLLLKEALTNAIKHAQCTELHFIVVYDGESLRIVIKDDGVGFNPEEGFSGKGLSTMKKRAEDLKAMFEIFSKPCNGTSIIIVIKI